VNPGAREGKAFVLCIICLRPVSCVPMDCPFFITPSIFFNVYIKVNLRRESQERILTFKLSRDHIKHGPLTLCCGIVNDEQNPGVNPGAREGKAFPVPYKKSTMLLIETCQSAFLLYNGTLNCFYLD
jgi:hypothetical protein